MTLAPLHHESLPGGPVAFRRSGTGVPLLLLHGWREVPRHWRPVFDGLANLRVCIAPDLPGHGETPPSRRAMDGEALADLVVALADRLGLETFDLAGHSFGAAVAVFLAARWPRRVRRLVLTSLGIPSTPLERFVLEQVHGPARQGLGLVRPWLALSRPWTALWQSWLERAFGAPPLYRAVASIYLRDLPEDDALVREGVLEFLRTDPLTALELAVAAGSPAFLPACDQVSAPTLLVAGTGDRILPLSAVRALVVRFRDAHLVELPGCGHLPMVERPVAYAAALRAFLARIESG